MDSYNYDSEALTSLIASLETKLGEYNTTIQNIENLKNRIESSTEWIQETVKPLFISKCEEYIKYFNDAITKLENHIEYLKAKNIAMELLEDTYS